MTCHSERSEESHRVEEQDEMFHCVQHDKEASVTCHSERSEESRRCTTPLEDEILRCVQNDN